jgi:hypothetical protein
MGKFSESISEQHKIFIEQQHLFFVSTAPLSNSGHINLSPKGLDSFRVLSPNRVAYMDIIGSGNETSAHISENKRITFMFCSFDKVPNILRLYGKGKAVLPGDTEWSEFSMHFNMYPSTRQIIMADIHLVQTSCGYGIPLFEFKSDRSMHFDWAEKKGVEGLKEYVKEKNSLSIDGMKIIVKD